MKTSKPGQMAFIRFTRRIDTTPPHMIRMKSYTYRYP